MNERSVAKLVVMPDRLWNVLDEVAKRKLKKRSQLIREYIVKCLREEGVEI